MKKFPTNLKRNKFKSDFIKIIRTAQTASFLFPLIILSFSNLLTLLPFFLPVFLLPFQISFFFLLNVFPFLISLFFFFLSLSSFELLKVYFFNDFLSHFVHTGTSRRSKIPRVKTFFFFFRRLQLDLSLLLSSFTRCPKYKFKFLTILNFWKKKRVLIVRTRVCVADIKNLSYFLGFNLTHTELIFD